MNDRARQVLLAEIKLRQKKIEELYKELGYQKLILNNKDAELCLVQEEFGDLLNGYLALGGSVDDTISG